MKFVQLSLLALLPTVVFCAAAADGARCNSTDGCLGSNSQCCTFIKQGIAGTGTNGLYCAPTSVDYETINGSSMRKRACHSTPELAHAYGDGTPVAQGS